MFGFPRFVHRYLDPGSRLGEILFGLIMALGIIGAVRLGVEDLTNRSMFIAILGCNLAWAVVDGVMYVLVDLFEQGRRHRLARSIQAEPDNEKAMALIHGELGPQLEALSSAESLKVFYAEVLKNVRGANPLVVSMHRETLLGGVASAFVIMIATAPILVPYLVVPNPRNAVRVSEAISIVLLFFLGAWWGRVVGGSPIKIGFGLTAIGGVLVGITILLGG